MRLYYMTRLEIAKLVLHKRRMKISQFDDLNDPFELLGASIGDRLARRVFNVILRKHWSQTLGIICMSDTWSNPVLWAHYADKHRGLCLGFEVPDDLCRKVHYEPSRLTGLLDPNKPNVGLTVETLQTVLSTKFKDWAYEREWRLFAGLKERDPNGYFYVDFGPALVLKEVIIGARCSTSSKSVAKLVGKTASSVRILKARAAFNRYEIVRQKQVAPITIAPD